MSTALDAATGQVRLLFDRTGRLLDGYEGRRDTSGIHLDRFKLAVGRHEVPLAALGTFVPRALKRRGDGRVSIFGAGAARFDPDGIGLESDGLSLGADFAVRHQVRLGAAVGYSRQPIGSGAFAETKTVSVHGAMSRSGLSVEVVAGGGLGRETRTRRRARSVLFAGGRARWSLVPLPKRVPRLKLAPSASAVGALGGTGWTVGTAAVTTGLTASHEIGSRWGRFAPQVSVERTAEMASGPHGRPDAALRLGIVGRLDGGPVLSVEHVMGWKGRNLDRHAVTGKLKLKY
ncbi:hypothetical protein [Arenibaculum sp.]|uniref:hypothetical protein n=1 Tax=Arenibaculum sp. TaxID=2865862 RepID=UPI002E14F174|nr:hypothetical protein [Arenibaculum sp.]